MIGTERKRAPKRPADSYTEAEIADRQVGYTAAYVARNRAEGKTRKTLLIDSDVDAKATRLIEHRKLRGFADLVERMIEAEPEPVDRVIR